MASEPSEGSLAGKGLVRFLGLGLLAPLHGLMLSLARLYVSGPAMRVVSPGCLSAVLGRQLLWLAPLGSYAALRAAPALWSKAFGGLALLHGVVSVVALGHLLFFADRSWDVPYQEAPKSPCLLRAVRLVFWFVVLGAKFLVAVVLFRAVFELPFGLTYCF